MHETSEMRVLRIRGRRANLLLLAQGKSRGLLLRSDFKGKVAAIRAKAKVSHLRVGNTLGLQARQGRGHPCSSISGKKQRTPAPQQFQGQGRGYYGQGQGRSS